MIEPSMFETGKRERKSDGFLCESKFSLNIAQTPVNSSTFEFWVQVIVVDRSAFYVVPNVMPLHLKIRQNDIYNIYLQMFRMRYEH